MFSAPTEKKARNFLSLHREKSTEFSQPPPRNKHGIFSASSRKKRKKWKAKSPETTGLRFRPQPK